MVLGDLYHRKREGSIRQDVISISPPPLERSVEHHHECFRSRHGCAVDGKAIGALGDLSAVLLRSMRLAGLRGSDQRTAQHLRHRVPASRAGAAAERFCMGRGVPQFSAANPAGKPELFFRSSLTPEPILQLLRAGRDHPGAGPAAVHHRRALGLETTIPATACSLRPAFYGRRRRAQAVWFAVSHAHRSPSAQETGFGRTCRRFHRAGWSPGAGERIREPKAAGRAGSGLGARLPGGNFQAAYRSICPHYFNHFADLGSTELQTSFTENAPAPPHIWCIPFINGNGVHGETHGMEISGNWQVAARWSLRPSYCCSKVHMHRDPSSQDTTVGGA